MHTPMRVMNANERFLHAVHIFLQAELLIVRLGGVELQALAKLFVEPVVAILRLGNFRPYPCTSSQSSSCTRARFCSAAESPRDVQRESSESVTKLTKFSPSGMNSSQPSMLKTRRAYNLMMFRFFLVSSKSNGARRGTNNNQVVQQEVYLDQHGCINAAPPEHGRVSERSVASNHRQSVLASNVLSRYEGSGSNQSKFSRSILLNGNLIHRVSDAKYLKTLLAPNAKKGREGHDSEAHENEVIKVNELPLYAFNVVLQAELLTLRPGGVELEPCRNLCTGVGNLMGNKFQALAKLFVGLHVVNVQLYHCRALLHQVHLDQVQGFVLE